MVIKLNLEHIEKLKILNIAEPTAFKIIKGRAVVQLKDNKLVASEELSKERLNFLYRQKGYEKEFKEFIFNLVKESLT